MEETKAIVEQWWIQLYDSIEPAKEKLNLNLELRKAYKKAYQKSDKYKAYQKEYYQKKKQQNF